MTDQPKTERIAIRVTPEFYKRLEKYAQVERRKVSDLVRIILEDEVQHHELQEPQPHYNKPNGEKRPA
jgi:predicted DNA-binding protein